MNFNFDFFGMWGDPPPPHTHLYKFVFRKKNEACFSLVPQRNYKCILFYILISIPFFSAASVASYVLKANVLQLEVK